MTSSVVRSSRSMFRQTASALPPPLHRSTSHIEVTQSPRTLLTVVFLWLTTDDFSTLSQLLFELNVLVSLFVCRFDIIIHFLVAFDTI